MEKLKNRRFPEKNSPGWNRRVDVEQNIREVGGGLGNIYALQEDVGLGYGGYASLASLSHERGKPLAQQRRVQLAAVGGQRGAANGRVRRWLLHRLLLAQRSDDTEDGGVRTSTTPASAFVIGKLTSHGRGSNTRRAFCSSFRLTK